MKITSIARVSSIAAISALALTACGSSSNNDSGNGSSGGSNSAAGGSGAAAKASDCGSGAIKASGSTAQKNVMDQATSSYGNDCKGATVTYTGNGSGKGITDFIGKQTQFAGSDSALNPEKGEPAKAKATCGSDALDIPMVTGPIAVAYNLKGVGSLNLTNELIAKIFSGKITKWNDPAIAKENSGVSLPDKAISVFYRADSSGTTDNFTKYMNTTDKADWADKHSKSWTGKVGQGKTASAGVGQAVQSQEGAITYVEWSYAQLNKLSMAKVNGVELTADSAAKGVESAQVTGTGKDLTLKLDYSTKTSGAYPIILVTYEIACSKYANATDGKNVKAFLTYMASDSFQKSLTQYGSAPLPSSIQDKVKSTVASIS